MKKAPTTNGKTRVTFELPAAVVGSSIVVCGDFNQWSTTANPLKLRKDGSRSTTLSLAPGRYRYRFLVDGAQWENDWAADAYEPNEHGTHNSVVEV